MKTNYCHKFFCLYLILALTGCAGTTASGPYYYLLSPLAGNMEPYKMSPFTLGLGPVQLPTHLDREGIITYTNQSQLDYADNHRWAEPLRESMVQVLQTDLSQLMPQQQVIVFPWKQDSQPRYQVAITIAQFGYKEANQVILIANWALSRRGRQLEAGNTQLVIEDVSGGYADIVDAQSQLLAMLANEIAQAIAGL